jgi:nucleotide-binding universal stress UspA family protein
VLVAVDFSSASAGVARTGLAAASDLGADGVDLVYVLEPMPHPVRWIDETLLDLLPGIRERAGAALRDLAADIAPGEGGPDIGLYVERGKAARTVARTAEALGSRLVVVGPHAERPVFDTLLGSVAEGIVRRAACPVWVARATAAPASDERV